MFDLVTVKVFDTMITLSIAAVITICSLSAFYAVWIKRVVFYMPSHHSDAGSNCSGECLKKFDTFNGYLGALFKRLWRLEGEYWIRYTSFESK